MNDSMANHPMMDMGGPPDWCVATLILLGTLALLAGMLKGCGVT